MDAGTAQCFLRVLLQLPEEAIHTPEYLSLLLPGAPPTCVSWWSPSPLGQLWAASTQVSVGAGCTLPFSIGGEALLLPLRRTRPTVWKDEETPPTPPPTHTLWMLAPHKGQEEISPCRPVCRAGSHEVLGGGAGGGSAHYLR